MIHPRTSLSKFGDNIIGYFLLFYRVSTPPPGQGSTGPISTAQVTPWPKIFSKRHQAIKKANDMNVNPRIITHMDLKGEFVVKGINLEGIRPVGKPDALAKKFFLPISRVPMLT